MNRLEELRSALVPVLDKGTWKDIEADHKRVQLAWRPDLEPGWGKPRYVQKVLADLPDDELIVLGGRCVDVFPERAGITVQNALWHLEAGGRTEITEITRVALADAFDGRVMHPHENPKDFLQRFGVTSSGIFDYPVGYQSDGTLYREKIDLGILARVERSSGSREPYTHRKLLDSLDFRSWPDRRVFQLLEVLVHPTVRTGDEQSDWVDFINSFITRDRFELIETASISGHPLFTVGRRGRGVGGKPKNLIFASTGPKPELGFRDAVNNDIVILKHAEHCLVYGEQIGDDGLSWNDLVGWWARMHNRDPAAPDVRRELGMRLRQSATGSFVEGQLFDAYFKRYRPLLDSRLPALLPQVYLHYDPVTIRQLRARGEDKRFPVQRMDFLLLLPERVRVVLEVDGKQHYSEGDGRSARPSPKKYAETIGADRDLRLMGYEVYRFGGYEFQGSARRDKTVTEFFDRLFQRHGLLP